MIREATEGDLQRIVELVVELATYEREPDAVRLDVPLLREALLAPDAVARCFLACPEGEPEEVVGMALWFRTFSTWVGRPGIHLEDLYVSPDHRGAGHGRALLAALAREAVTRGYGRLEWAVLDWNEPAIGFYRSLGAGPQEGWGTFRLDGAALQALGAP